MKGKKGTIVIWEGSSGSWTPYKVLQDYTKKEAAMEYDSSTYWIESYSRLTKEEKEYVLHELHYSQ